MPQSLAERDLASLLAVSVEDVRSATGGVLPELHCTFLTGESRDLAILGVLHELDRDLRIVGGGDGTVWDSGWGEVLADVRRQGFRLEVLIPHYFRGQMVLRLGGEYVTAKTASFVTDLDLLLRRLVFRRHLVDTSRLVEIGCGSGLNLLLARELCPTAELHGADWAQASVEILALAESTVGNLTGSRFNMLTLEGEAALPIDGGTTVLTVHALEQLGSAVQSLLDLLLQRRPKLCVHLEPLAELYDPSKLFDHLALRYHTKRNYLTGFLSTLDRLAEMSRIEILDRHRFGFGSQFHEAYSLVVWRPR
jgi:hypothetical protein